MSAGRVTPVSAGFHPQWIVPDWPAPPNVRALITTRRGGVSQGVYAAPASAAEQGGMNLGRGSGESLDIVEANRAGLRALLPHEPCWLHQVHGADVIDAARARDVPARADASMVQGPGAGWLPALFKTPSPRCARARPTPNGSPTWDRPSVRRCSKSAPRCLRRCARVCRRLTRRLLRRTLPASIWLICSRSGGRRWRRPA